MKKVLPIAGNRFPQKTFAVLAVIALVAFLLTLKPVSEIVKTGAEKLGINFPPLDVFRNVADQINKFALGGMLLCVGLIVGLVGLKIAVIIIAVASIAYAGYALYNWLTNGVVKDTLPVPMNYGDPIYPGGKK